MRFINKLQNRRRGLIKKLFTGSYYELITGQIGAGLIQSKFINLPGERQPF